ncbi:MAG: TetR/AcrR family transcriptional regulator [Chloroflexota bacterium]|nr:TetR/AcrR family transcriptional regulator [Chloroflexota bacterium]
MTKLNSSKRKYDSTRRQAQADETRRQILTAAHKFFIERGYAGATIETIAIEAGVAPETIYAIFKNKGKILISLINFLSASKAEEKIPLLQRAGPQAVAQEHDQRRQLQLFAQVVANNLEGNASISEIILVAAKTDQNIEKIMQQFIKQRRQHMAVAVQQIAANGQFRDNMDEEYATDTVWALASPEVFLLLTRDLGWSKDKYEQWLVDTLIIVLLP